jgi:hypothetical protein
MVVGSLDGLNGQRDQSGDWHTIVPDLPRAFPECAADEDFHAGFELVTGTWLSAWTRTYTTRPGPTA